MTAGGYEQIEKLTIKLDPSVPVSMNFVIGSRNPGRFDVHARLPGSQQWSVIFDGSTFLRAGEQSAEVTLNYNISKIIGGFIGASFQILTPASPGSYSAKCFLTQNKKLVDGSLADFSGNTNKGVVLLWANYTVQQ